MEKNYYNLGSVENNRFVKILQIIFGVACIAVGVIWVFFSPDTIKSNGTFWISVIFLIGFGAYQIWAGSGRSTRFIEIENERIRLKRNAVLPPIMILPPELEKIEFFPLNIVFYMKSKKRILMRFGAMYHETNEKIFEELVKFAETNNIPMTVTEESL